MKLLIIVVALNLLQNEIGVDAQKFNFKGSRMGNSRIIGGEMVLDIENYQFTAVLIEEWGHTTTFLCACAKVARFWVLTTAKCISSELAAAQNRGTLFVRGNTVRWLDYGNDDHQVIKVVKHPSYDADNYDNDVAVVKVLDPFQWGTWLQLSHESMVKNSLNITTLGWGSQNMEGMDYIMQNLYVIELKVHDWATCKNELKINLTKTQFCAGAKYRGTCTHDSGGPVFASKDNKKFLIGLVSFTYDGLCGVSSYTSIFTNLWVVRSWIWKHIGAESSKS